MEGATLYKGDCLEVMRSLPAGSIDMVLCDLPYGTTNNSWDNPLPLNELWDNYRRVTKGNAAIILFGQSKFSAELIMSSKELYRYTIIWEKTKAGGFLNARRMPLQAHEDMLVFYQRLPTYNPQMQAGKPYTKKCVTNGDGKSYGKFERVGTTLVNEGLRFPRSVIKFSNDNHNSLHPTQKPVQLLEYLILTYSNEGDVILDNCMGSGSTAIACLNVNRKFIGIEKNDEYFNIAKKRIESYKT